MLEWPELLEIPLMIYYEKKNAELPAGNAQAATDTSMHGRRGVEHAGDETCSGGEAREKEPRIAGDPNHPYTDAAAVRCQMRQGRAMPPGAERERTLN